MTLPFDAEPGRGRASDPRRPAGNRRRPDRRGATGQDPPRAAPPRRAAAHSRSGIATTARSTPHRCSSCSPAEARRWGRSSDADLAGLAARPGRRPSRWLLGDGDSNGDGFIDYRRGDPSGLSNQGWKDSWDGITFADGDLPDRPDRARRGPGLRCTPRSSARPSSPSVMPAPLPRPSSGTRADRLREPLQRAVLGRARAGSRSGSTATGRAIDSLTTNPGHALWSGIADPAMADRYLDRLMERRRCGRAGACAPWPTRWPPTTR